ncbi:MAG TPA: T9SS type A sorting domain-containing protein [Acidobacteriota bacterium]|nr:T9SS type A sorting domain-containing protein [Acidobacteriota bacterium]
MRNAFQSLKFTVLLAFIVLAPLILSTAVKTATPPGDVDPNGSGAYGQAPACLEVSPDTLWFFGNLCWTTLTPDEMDSQFVMVSNCDTGTLEWVASVDQSWIGLEPDSGQNFDSVAVWIVWSEIPDFFTPPLPGDTILLSAIITVEAPGATNSPQHVTAMLGLYCESDSWILVVEPSRFDLVAAPGDTLVETFYVSEASGREVEFELSNSSDWLTFPPSVDSLTTPDSVQFYVSTAGLSPGVYHDTILAFTYAEPSNSPVRVPVELTVYDTGGLELAVDPTHLEFVATTGIPLENSLYIWEKSGDTTVILSFWNSSSWLQLPLFLVAPTTPTTLWVTVDPAGLLPGVYHDTVVISGYDSTTWIGDLAVPVTLTVPGDSDLVVLTEPMSFNWTVNQGEKVYDSLFVDERFGRSVEFMVYSLRPWLIVPGSGTDIFATPETLHIGGDATSLDPGTYTDSIIVFPAIDCTFVSAAVDPMLFPIVLVPVAMTVVPSRPVVHTIPTHFAFTLNQGDTLDNQCLLVYEESGGNVPFAVQTTQGSSWLQPGPGPTDMGVTPDTVCFAICTDMLPPGIYVDSLMIFDPLDDTLSFEPVKVPVVLTIAGEPPEWVVETQPASLHYALPEETVLYDSLLVYEKYGFMAHFVIFNGSSWLDILSVPPPPGVFVTPEMIDLRIHTDSLPLGIYYDTIHIYPDTGWSDPFLPVAVPVVLTMAPPEPILHVVPERFDLSLNTGDSLLGQRMWVYEESGGIVPFAVYTALGSPWLQIWPDSTWMRHTPDSVHFDVYAGSLPAGVYTDTIIVTNSLAQIPLNAEVKVPVVLTVSGGPSEWVVKTVPTSFYFSMPDEYIVFDSLWVYEEGGQPAHFFVSDRRIWLDIVSTPPPAGVFVTPTMLTIKVHTDSLSYGTYYDTIDIFPDTGWPDPFEAVHIPVMLDVVPGWVGDSLLIPSLVFGTPFPSPQPVLCVLTKSASGATIPIEIPPGVTVHDVSFEGLPTESWDFKLVDIKNDSGFVVVNLANSSGKYIPAGVTWLFDIEFSTSMDCRDDQYIHWDTALSADPSRQLKFSDVMHQTFVVGFDYYRDSTLIPGYTPGDCDGVPPVDIGDLTSMIGYMFLGEPAPLELNALDVNGDCGGPDIGDITYFIAYLFLFGEELRCGCLGADVPVAAKLSTDVRILTAWEGGATIISLASPHDVRGLQLELSGPEDASAVKLTGEEFDLVYGQAGSVVKLGLFDADGGTMIPAGTTPVIRLDGEYEVTSALVADENHHVITPLVNGAARGSAMPADFALEQNYPNPFNPATDIKFSLREASHVRLEVYNIMGQRVATLVDKRLEAGSHVVTWDASDAASGVYLYRLQAGDFTHTRKMTLLK